jgi:secreted trypsin-like serine protease
MSFRPRYFAVILALLFSLPHDPANAIINGGAPREDEFPWIAAIIKKGSFSTVPVIGGGALLGDQWIATTAHSLVEESPASIEVWLQTPDLTELSRRIRRNVLAIYRHPDFVTANGTSLNDIALLLLDQPVTSIEPVSFETSESNLFEKDSVVTAGWGTTIAGEIVPSTQLQKAGLELLTRGDGNAFYGGILTIAHIPARDPFSLSMPCFGDSGGPLLKAINGVDTLIGLVSFGPSDCGDASIPSVFTNITAYDEWIRDFLDTTNLPPDLMITGRARSISDGDRSPRSADNTDFGTFSPRRRTVTKAFRAENPGSGLLTVRGVTTSGKLFPVRSAPAKLIAAGSSSAFRVRFRSPRKRKRAHATVKLFTNDPAQPVVTFRVRATVR